VRIAGAQRTRAAFYDASIEVDGHECVARQDEPDSVKTRQAVLDGVGRAPKIAAADSPILVSSKAIQISALAGRLRSCCRVRRSHISALTPNEVSDVYDSLVNVDLVAEAEHLSFVNER
jgi:hypothetical protein